jgi:hypothetical protein
MKEKVKMVTIQGGKGQANENLTVSKDDAVLILNGNVFNLDSFILCGTSIEDGEPDRVVLTWNSSVDEMVVYKNTLSVKIEDKLRESLGGYSQGSEMEQIMVRLNNVEASQKKISGRLDNVETGQKKITGLLENVESSQIDITTRNKKVENDQKEI